MFTLEIQKHSLVLISFQPKLKGGNRDKQKSAMVKVLDVVHFRPINQTKTKRKDDLTQSLPPIPGRPISP